MQPVDEALRQLRRDNRNAVQDAKRTLNSSRIPSAIKATLALLFDHIGAASNYECAWVSQATLAKIQGKAIRPNRTENRAIERHIQVARDAGLITVQTFSTTEGIAFLKEKYNHHCKCRSAKLMAFYRINFANGFWHKDKEATRETLSKVIQGMVNWNKKRTSRKLSNPVTGDGVCEGLNPVTRDAVNPVTGDGQSPIKEKKETSLAPRSLLPLSLSPKATPQRQEWGAPAERQEKATGGEAEALLNELEIHLAESRNLRMPPRGREKMLATLDALNAELGAFPTLTTLATAITSFRLKTEISYSLLLSATFFERFINQLTEAVRLEAERQTEIKRNDEEYEIWCRNLTPEQRVLKGIGSEEDRLIAENDRAARKAAKAKAALEAENKFRDATGMPRVDSIDDYSGHLAKFRD